MKLNRRDYFYKSRDANRKNSTSNVVSPGRNVWRMETARRATMLVDGGCYFGALRQAMLNAQRSIYIIGWDIDSRMALVDETGKVSDGFPETLGAFLAALVERRPDLSIKLLLWDYSFFYALEREFLPSLALGVNTPPQVEFRLDNAVPIGSSHHQKVVVVDDAVAFSGGLDLTIRRWDNCDHTPGNECRVDPAQAGYRPFHDVQMIVDGKAAAALAELVRRRWKAAGNEPLPPVAPLGDPWPENVRPDLFNIGVGIARTCPAYGDGRQVREVERLYMDMFAAARRFIYIENQFLTSRAIARSLAAALSRNPELELLMVAPKTHHTWFEHQTMLAGRIRFMSHFHEAGVANRVRLVYPCVTQPEGAPEDIDVMVHSKITIIDDRILRVGSSNLCNRSMGTDSECDLVVEAESDAHRKAIASMRNRLLCEHSAASVEELEQGFAGQTSILTLLDNISGRGRGFCPIDDGELADSEFFQEITALADPDEPLGVERMIDDDEDPRMHSAIRFIRIVALPVALLALALTWRYTPLAEMITPQNVQSFLASIGNEPWTLPVLVVIFVLGGLVLFPVTVLIAATALTFGIWPGLPYALAGAFASALVTYFIGAHLGEESLRRILGSRVGVIAEKMGKHGIVAVTAVRLVPVLPFSLVNLVAGALRIRLLDYSVGTVLGLAPGLLVMTLLGSQLSEILLDPSWETVGIFALFLAVWMGLGLGLQALAGKIHRYAGS